VSHGEAVAIGMALDTHYSVLVGLLEPGQDTRVLRLLKRLGFGLWREELEERDAHGRWSLWDGLTEFREHLGGELCVTLLAGIGRGVEVGEMDPGLFSESVDWLKKRPDPCDWIG
jgi:3-dehydroquinate synthase